MNLLFRTFSASLFMSLVMISCQSHKGHDNDLKVDLSDKLNVPKHYIVSKTTNAIHIDGRDDEGAWDQAEFTDSFIDIEGIQIPEYKTQVKMLWDDTFLYVYAELEEPHIWGSITKRDSIIYWNNDFEVFIDPSRDGLTYGEIEINALGTEWDLFLDKPYRVGGKANFNWNLNELKTAVDIRGSLNDPSDIDTLWSVEMAIPLKAYCELKNRPKTLPKEGEQWSINFSRVQWQHSVTNGIYHKKKENDKLLKESNWVWTKQLTVNMHQPEHWGTLQFTEATSSEDVSFIEDRNLQLKQSLYALFRETRYGDLKYLLDNSTGKNLSLKLYQSQQDSTFAIFNKTKFGFEYEMKSEVDSSSFIINQEGLLKKIR